MVDDKLKSVKLQLDTIVVESCTRWRFDIATAVIVGDEVDCALLTVGVPDDQLDEAEAASSVVGLLDVWRRPDWVHPEGPLARFEASVGVEAAWAAVRGSVRAYWLWDTAVDASLDEDGDELVEEK